MALLKCLDCGHDVSDLAASCPHCGRPVSTMLPPPPSEPSPLLPQASTDEAPAPPAVEELKRSSGCIVAILGVSVFVVILIALLASMGEHSTPDQPAATAQEQPQKPPSAAELLAMLKSEQSAGRQESALQYARDLVNSHSGTPEAKEAASQITKLEAAVEAAQEAERVRAAEAAAEAEAQRLAAKWSYRVDDDPMTSRKARYASIESENTLSFDFPYQGEQHGRLMLRDHPTHGRDVMVLIDKGQILCPSYEDCSIRVRFDEGKSQRWSAAGPADNSSTVIFLRNEGGFIQKLRGAKVIRIQIPVYQEGEPMLEFYVGGFDYSRFRGGE